MALTPKERARRYREKQKQDPAKYEAHKKKELKRLKECQKKIADLSEEEKAKKRQLWRDQKKKQRSKKKQENTTRSSSPTTPKAIPQNSNKALSYKIKLKKIRTLYNNALMKIKKLQASVACKRKREQRSRNCHAQQVSSLTNENNKLKARQEILELTLRCAYENSKNNKERRVLKEAAMKHRVGNTALGLKSNIRLYRKTRFVNKTAQKDIESFYLRDDVSRMTAGKKECRTKNKQKKQKRYLLDTFLNLYQIYRNEGGKYSYATFFNYKPFFILSPTAASRNTCLCVKHDNMALIFNALRRYSVLTYTNLKELLEKVCCDTGSYDCMYNKCEKCKSTTLQVNQEKLDNRIKLYQWTRVDHNYQKSGTEKTTKKTVKKEITGTAQDLIFELQKQLPRYKTHVYNAKVQQEQYRSCVIDLQDDEVLILCDFSENYECKLGEEVQSLHFGASKQAVTLHCGMIYTNTKSQSFVTVSNNNCHEPHAIWAHLIPIISVARSMNPNVSVIHFYSDGPSSQYRQKKNFYLLNKFTPKLKLKYSTWSFSEAGHGKSVADGIGGAAKRLLDKRVSYGEDIVDAEDVFNILTNRMKSTCYLISDEEIQNVATLVPNNIQPIPGTMQVHQIISIEPNIIKYRVLSCFCSKHANRGMCSCHDPKQHALVRKEELLLQRKVEPKTQDDRSSSKIQTTKDQNMNSVPAYASTGQEICDSFSTSASLSDHILLKNVALLSQVTESEPTTSLEVIDSSKLQSVENIFSLDDSQKNIDLLSQKNENLNDDDKCILTKNFDCDLLSNIDYFLYDENIENRPTSDMDQNANDCLEIPTSDSVHRVKIDHPGSSEDIVRPVKEAEVIMPGETLAESNQMLRTQQTLPGNVTDRHKRSRLATSDVTDKITVPIKKVKTLHPVNEKLQPQNQQLNVIDITLKPKNRQLCSTSQRSKVKIISNICVAGPSYTYLCSVCKMHRSRNSSLKCSICQKNVCAVCSDGQCSPGSLYICVICLES